MDRGSEGLIPSTPTATLRSHQRQIESPGARQGRGTEAGELAMIVDPLRDRELARVHRKFGRMRVPHRDPAGVVGEQVRPSAL